MLKQDWQWAVVLALMAIAGALYVLMWDHTVAALKEFEHRITKLEQQMEAMRNASSQ